MPFLISSRSIVVNLGSGIVDFSVVCSAPPDFNLFDANRQENEFQIHVINSGYAATVENAWNRPDSIIRAGEIYKDGLIVVRVPPPEWNPATRLPIEWARDDPPAATAAFTVDGNTVEFSLPLATIAPSWPGGNFAYTILSVERGSYGNGLGTPEILGTATVV